MRVDVQKRLMADIIKGSSKRVKFDPARLEEIKEAITKQDIKALVDDGAITILPKRGVSRSRKRDKDQQKKKGKRRGMGSRKGTKNARSSSKTEWVNKIRLQRKYLKELKEAKKLSNKNYRSLYLKAKGGFFRSKRHINLYINEQGLLEKNAKKNE